MKKKQDDSAAHELRDCPVPPVKGAITDGSDAEPVAAETAAEAAEEVTDETTSEEAAAEATEETVTIVFDEEESAPEADVPAGEASSAEEEKDPEEGEKSNDNPVAFDF